MPFDYDDYQKKVNGLTTEQLHKEWENYTRQMAGGATSTATSVLFSPLTGGISLLGLGLSAPRIHNARKKREIIEAGLQARGTTHNTRKRDVVAPMAVAGTLGGLTLGLAGPGADIIAGEVVGHGVEYAVSHAALDATGAVLEHTHDEHSKKKAEHKLQLQYQNFQQQYMQEHAKIQGVQPQVVGMQPGTLVSQPGPQYQTQSPGQDQKYELVPVPTAHGFPVPNQKFADQQQVTLPVTQTQIAYLPASHQQQLSPTPRPSISSQYLAQVQPIQQPEKVLVTVPVLTAQAGPIELSYFPEKSAAYAASVPRIGQDEPIRSSIASIPPCETPLPDYSEPHTMQAVANAPGEESPPTISLEEEIAFLKARLLQMELEKRGETFQAPVSIIQPQPVNSHNPVAQNKEPASVQVTIVPAEPDQQEQMLNISHPSSDQLQQQHYPPPPPSPAVPPRSPSIPTSQHAPPLEASSQPIQNYPPRPPSPNTYNPAQFANPKMQNYPPPPPSPIYQPQNYPQAPSAGLVQQSYPRPPNPPIFQEQPQYQRHDSGYYSAVPTPQPISAQSTGNQYLHGRNPSQASLSPMSPPPPPPYFPPPPGVVSGNVGGKDYFSQGPVPNAQNYRPAPQASPVKGPMGTQGWQWGVPAPVGQRPEEPNYGPPPPIPAPWRGS